MTNHALPEEYELKTPEATAAGRRSTWVSVWVNVVLTTGQLAAGLFAQSQALVADAIHSLSDLMADFVVLIAGHHSQKEADDDHHYGHHRYENAASLVLGVLLLFVAGGMLWAAVRKLQEPDLIPTVHQAALWVALLALISKEVLFRYMLKVATRIRSSMLVANAWHARSDALSSLVVALGIIGNMFGYPLLDPIAALVVGLLVGKMGWGFSWSALHDLMDRAVSEEETAAIRETVIATPGVRGVHDLRTRRVGDFAIVDVHLEVDAKITVLQGHDIAVAARRRIMEKHKVLDVMTHLDPHGHADLG
ncbi:MAG: cation transporter [Oxalobacter sp.]|nr:MAG: cation transporter [Oxalobacter sp.]